MNFWARFPCRIWAHEKLPFFLSVGIAVTFETPPILHLYQFLPIRHRPHSIEPRHRNHCQMSREGRRERDPPEDTEAPEDPLAKVSLLGRGDKHPHSPHH